MNQLTLCFDSCILEQKFQKEITHTNQELFRKVFMVHLILVITPSLIISALQWEKAGMMLFFASLLANLSQILFYKIMQKCFNLIINSMILASSIFVCILVQIFGTNLQINDPNMLFYLGSCIYTIQIGMSLFSSSFIMTSIAVIISVIFFSLAFLSPGIYGIKLAFFAITIFYLYVVYITQKNRRELFLFKENQKQWSEIVKKVIPSSIITVKYDQKNNQLFLDSINDEAKKFLKIFDQDQFKIFSRKTVVFDKFQEIDENEDQKSLENKFQDRKNQIQEMFYGSFKQEEMQIDKIISVKASPYQNQTDFLCCLVIEEQTNNQKIKALEIINKTFETNFLQFCLYLGDKLQNIIFNIYNEQIIKANIYQCYNKIYNYKDHALIVKNQFKFKINNCRIQQISLEEFKSLIQSRFLNKINELDIKFSSKNCDFSTQIYTCVDKLNQIITNLIENSLKFQKMELQTTYYDQSANTSYRSRCFSSQLNSQTKRIEQDSNNKDSVLSNFLIDFNEYAANKSVFKSDQSGNKFEILNSSRNDISGLEILQVQETILNKTDVNINIELIKGENKYSNIFKISVCDRGQGMSNQNIIQILEIIANKNSVFNSDYQNYNFIGWKVNHQIIGKIGPFYSFYVKSDKNQGLEYHFYIFQDIDILNQTQNNSQIKLFQNSQFQEYLQESNQNYYHVNNIEFLKENVKQNSKNSKIRMKNNSTLNSQPMNYYSSRFQQQNSKLSRKSSTNRLVDVHKINQTTSNCIEESECSLSQNYTKKNTPNSVLTIQSALKINQEKFQGFQKYFQEQDQGF
ncbi:hypothetical protein ABPG72_000695 [Tetrahymena utriculariae]